MIDDKIEEIFFLIAGIGMLAALPYLEQESYFIWYVAKIFYFAGVILFIYKVASKKY